MLIFIMVLNIDMHSQLRRRHEQVRLRNMELLVSGAGSAVALAGLAHTNESYLSQVHRHLPSPNGIPYGVSPTSSPRGLSALSASHTAGWTSHMNPKALNPDWPDRIIKINEHATICEVVVSKGDVV